jgi:hypothetical protein
MLFVFQTLNSKMLFVFQTLDNLPLSHPEHFGTPVMHGKKTKRGRYSGGLVNCCVELR